ncbi:MAG: hypothetical protein AAFN09_17640, partial [Pseudomonadota bacterium]
LTRKIEDMEGVDKVKSRAWYKDKYMTSNFESYIHAIQEQEIPTKYIRHKRQGIHQDDKCRLCKQKTEDINHVISSCPKMSSRYYLPLRHDVVAKTIWKGLSKRNPLPTTEEYIESDGKKELWWNLKIKTTNKLKHNRPDIVVWDHEEKTCSVIEISCPLDMNIIKKIKEKEDTYGPLLRSLQLQHPGYRFSFIPIIIGATGYLPNGIEENLAKLGFTPRESKIIVGKCQMATIGGTVKISKTFMGFRT